jgi:hypothetical protein
VSGSEKTFSFIRTILTYQERLEGLDTKLKGLSDDLARLATSHGNLRDRVSRLEGVIEGVGMANSASQPKLPRR